MRGIHIIRHLTPGWWIADEGERAVYRRFVYARQGRPKRVASRTKQRLDPKAQP